MLCVSCLLKVFRIKFFYCSRLSVKFNVVNCVGLVRWFFKVCRGSAVILEVITDDKFHRFKY